MRNFSRFLALRESVLTGDVEGMLRRYWSGDFECAPILADAMDDAVHGMGDLVRLPAQMDMSRRAKLVYNAAFRRYWPEIVAAAPVQDVYVGNESMITAPCVNFSWRNSPGSVETLGGGTWNYYRHALMFRYHLNEPVAGWEPDAPVTVMFWSRVIQNMPSGTYDELSERMGCEISHQPGWSVLNRQEYLYNSGSELCYLRQPQPGDFPVPLMLRAAVTAGSTYGARDVQRLASLDG